MRQEFNFLLAKPKISQVNKGIQHWDVFQGLAGKSDAKKNQICEAEDGYTSPRINTKAGYLDSYNDGIYLKVASELEPMVAEAGRLATQLSMITPESGNTDGLHPEEAARRAKSAAARAAANASKRESALVRLSELKAESDMVDEALAHHIESATGIFDAKIAKYWSGVLQKAKHPNNYGYEPVVKHKDYPGRKKYYENREDLISLIQATLEKEGVA